MKLILTKLTDDQLDGLEDACRNVRLQAKNKRLDNTVTLPDEAFDAASIPVVYPSTPWTPNKADFKQTD